MCGCGAQAFEAGLRVLDTVTRHDEKGERGAGMSRPVLLGLRPSKSQNCGSSWIYFLNSPEPSLRGQKTESKAKALPTVPRT